MSEIFDIAQAAAHFKVSTKTIRNMIKEGILPYFMIGGYKFTADDFAVAEQNLRKQATNKQATDKHKAVRPPKKDREPVLV